MDDFNMEKFVKNLKRDMCEGFGNLTNKFKETIDTMENNTMNNSKASNAETKKGIGLSSPWWEYYHKLLALFEQDPEIHMEYDDLKKGIVMRVDNWKKADAIRELLPSEVFFGNVKVKISVITSNYDCIPNRAKLFETAFDGNPIFDQVITIDGSVPITGGTAYVMFKKKVAQFFNDNLADPRGNSSYLCADIAEDVFGHVEGEALHFSTSTEE